MGTHASCALFSESNIPADPSVETPTANRIVTLGLRGVKGGCRQPALAWASSRLVLRHRGAPRVPAPARQPEVWIQHAVSTPGNVPDLDVPADHRLLLAGSDLLGSKAASTRACQASKPVARGSCLRPGAGVLDRTNLK